MPHQWVGGKAEIPLRAEKAKGRRSRLEAPPRKCYARRTLTILP